MSSERLLPTEKEISEYQQKLDDTFDKVKVAGATTGAFTVASLVFPPASAGALVTAGEMVRQGVKLNLEVIKFHRKYPGIDKK